MFKKCSITAALLILTIGASHAQELSSAYECKIDRFFSQLKTNSGQLIHKLETTSTATAFVSQKYIIWNVDGQSTSFTYQKTRGDDLIYTGEVNGNKTTVTTTAWKVQNVGGFEFVSKFARRPLVMETSFRGRCQPINN